MRITAKDIKETKALARNECPCNYSGDCVLFDCGCIVQNSHYSLAEGKIICLYFRDNVLPLDPHLSTLYGEQNGKYIKCPTCGKSFKPTGNRQKFCTICKESERRKKKAAWYRQNYSG